MRLSLASTDTRSASQFRVCEVYMAQLCYDPALDAAHPPTAYDDVGSTFFSNNDSGKSRQLPATADVQAKSDIFDFGEVIFPELGVFVKFGPAYRVSIEEAQTMQAIRRAFPNGEIVIPEFFGWKTDGDLNFIYMSLIQGITLRKAWPSSTQEDRIRITSDLSRMLNLLRSATLPEGKRHVGSICGTRVQGAYLSRDVDATAFDNVSDYNDRLMLLSAANLTLDFKQICPVRGLLPDNAEICFSHGDLNASNIMIGGQPGAYFIAAIVDWGDSGWYPDYWEYCMLFMGCDKLGQEWLHKILTPHEDAYEAFEYYWHSSPP